MHKSGWLLALIVVVVFGFAGSLQFGLLDDSGDGNPVCRESDGADLFSAAGWRYRQGNPTHWKRYVMNPE